MGLAPATAPGAAAAIPTLLANLVGRQVCLPGTVSRATAFRPFPALITQEGARIPLVETTGTRAALALEALSPPTVGFAGARAPIFALICGTVVQTPQGPGLDVSFVLPLTGIFPASI